MTEFEKEIEPVVLWIKEKLKGRVPYSEELSISFCAALIKQHEKEALNIAGVGETCCDNPKPQLNNNLQKIKYCANCNSRI